MTRDDPGDLRGNSPSAPDVLQETFRGAYARMLEAKRDGLEVYVLAEYQQMRRTRPSWVRWYRTDSGSCCPQRGQTEPSQLAFSRLLEPEPSTMRFAAGRVELMSASAHVRWD